MGALLLDRDTAGPREWVTAMQRTPAFDFTAYPRAGIIVALTGVQTGGTGGARMLILPDIQVRSSAALAFRIPDVGPNDPNKVPEGRYRITIRLGMAAMLDADPELRVRIPRVIAVPGGATLRTFARHTLRLLGGAVAGPGRPLLLRLTGGAAIGAAAQAQQRVAAFNAAPQPGAPSNHVEFLIDGNANLLAIDTLLRTAGHYVYFAFLAIDEDTRFSPAGQSGPPATPQTHNLENAVAWALRAKPDGALDVKLLVWTPQTQWWNPTSGWVDPDLYTSYFTDIGGLAQLRVRWGDVRGSDWADFRRRIVQFSGAPLNFLTEFRDRWYHAVADTDTVLLPTGAHAATDEHPSLVGSHHQKFVLSDRGTWVGGLNLQKHYWDATEHVMGDMRRAHSGEDGLLPRAPDVGPWHDTGCVVRGPAGAEAGPTFEQRWNHAIARQSALESLIRLVRPVFPDLARRLESFRPRVSAATLQHRDPTAAAGTTVDQAVILETLPAGSGWTSQLPSHAASAPPPAAGTVPGPYRVLFGATSALSRFLHRLLAPFIPAPVRTAPLHFAAQNLEAYMEAIERMDEPYRADDGKYCFIYLENQYFTHAEVAKALLSRWERNVQASGPDLLEWAPPFAFVLLPYVPQPRFDIRQPAFDFVESEMMLLKWLELRTARRIMLRAADGTLEWWCELRQPEVNIRIAGAAHDDPEAMAEDTRFTVVRGVRLDPDTGLPKQPTELVDNESRTADQVLTVSDIMAYTLTSTHADNTVPRPIPWPPGTPRRREKEFLIANHVYVHSKCAFFANPRAGRHIGTTGSTNLNIRGLGRWRAGSQSVDPTTDTPDSEMNVWWKGELANQRFRGALWAHLLDVPEAEATESRWIERGEANLRRILNGGGALEGHVVRLDVTARNQNLP